MNKLVKGAIAGAAGVALLLGGAGTFAVWNDTVELSAPSITAGHLELGALDNGTWKVAGTSTPIDASTYRIIPGTTLEYTQTLTVDAEGDGLTAKLTNSGFGAAGALASITEETLAVTSTTATAVNGNELTFAAGDSTVDVKVTVKFPQEATGGQNAVLNLNDVTFTLTQTLPSA